MGGGEEQSNEKIVITNENKFSKVWIYAHC